MVSLATLSSTAPSSLLLDVVRDHLQQIIIKMVIFTGSCWELHGEEVGECGWGEGIVVSKSQTALSLSLSLSLSLTLTLSLSLSLADTHTYKHTHTPSTTNTYILTQTLVTCISVGLCEGLGHVDSGSEHAAGTGQTTVWPLAQNGLQVLLECPMKQIVLVDLRVHLSQQRVVWDREVPRQGRPV